MEQGQGYEIERKFLVRALPGDVERFPFHEIEQGYLCRTPTVRVRREDDIYYLTYKGIRQEGRLAQEEHNLPLTGEAYAQLLSKAEGVVISKRRYLVPLGERVVELDIFRGPYEGLVIAEVEFPSEEEAAAFCPEEWMGEEVTGDRRYCNSWLSGHAEDWRELSASPVTIQLAL